MCIANRQPLKVYLKPGDIYLMPEPAVVTTVLGSCVSITMYHPWLKVGGICHGLLPNGDGREGFKYVDCAFRYMLQQFRALGARAGEIQAKLFGGASLFSAEGGAGSLSVGSKNVKTAMALIRREGIKLAASDTGGKVGRKILFHTDTGEVFLKRLGSERCSCDREILKHSLPLGRPQKG